MLNSLNTITPRWFLELLTLLLSFHLIKSLVSSLNLLLGRRDTIEGSNLCELIYSDYITVKCTVFKIFTMIESSFIDKHVDLLVA